MNIFQRWIMKQYTNSDQAAKLIELGFESPQRNHIIEWNGTYKGNYSIGELIEMLPKEFDGELLEIAPVTLAIAKWMVRYPYGIIVYKSELIDALYEMVVKLKEEGVI